MSSLLGVRQWFPTEPGDLAREFGISFVGDDDDEDLVKQECVSPHGDEGDVEQEGAYGGVFMVNSGEEPFGPVISDACRAEPLAMEEEEEDQCRQASSSSSESAVRGLLRDLVSTVATSDESLPQRPPVAPPIDDCKAVQPQRRRSSSSGGKCKRRKRSTSCSTTSSTGSTRHHHHHHKHHRKHRRRKSKTTSGDELEAAGAPTPRVNPIFVWVKQDDTRIVEVLCEDYDKRNRIRIKRTAQGWRAIPRTERLASAVPAPPPCNSSSSEAPQGAVTSSLVSNPIEEEEEEIEDEDEEDDGPVTKETFEEEEEEEEVEGYPEPEDSEMEPTDLSIPKTTFGEIEIIPLKAGTNPILPAAPPPIHSPATIEPIPPSPPVPAARPAHQPKPQHKSMFLESLLSSPRKCHHPVAKLEQTNSEELRPLDLGMSLIRSSGSPTVSCSEERKPPEPDIEPKVKRLKVEDITLKNLLNKTVTLDKERKTPTDSTKSHKSRLLELLTSEPAPASQASLDQDLSPLTQLKKILSDPELSVPDPLLVPRDRLHSLLACPAREIPHLLSVRPELRLPEALAYPALVRDPDLLVVSLSHLQRLLEKPEDDCGNYITLRDWQRYQSELIDSQLKQQQQQHQNPNGSDLPADLDAGTAAALNQLLWLPYLTQLEAAAMACGNNQEFLTMLNAVFPPTNYPQVQGGSASFLPPFTVPPTDFKTQMELQQTLALWQEAMVQATVTASSVNNNNNNTTSNNNNLLPGKNISGANKNRLSHPAKKPNSSSARTSPISPNFQHAQHHQQQRSAINNQQQQQQYLSTTNGYNNHHHQYNQQRSHLPQPVRNNTSGPQRPLKSEADTDRLKPKVTCKSLINLLSSTKKQEQELATIKRSPSTPSPQQHSHLLAALGNPPGNMPHLVPITQEPVHAPTNNPIDLSGRARSKLKVKQHLVDPAITPRLLKQDADKVGHPQLWHPLFGR
ncbi:hypothetical protein C0J52_21114 [Blattella germanica]|nr:hypothetical protein C0J52_21114 [Blattella germanica]